MRRVKVFLFCISFLTLHLKAVDKGPEILRICLDNNTSIATLFWQPTTDVCKSFTQYHIYSSENGGPWKKEKSITDLSKTECSLLLSDPGADWKFKIVTYLACNGVDSFESAAQSIDNNKPQQIEIDSVSFDYLTQKVMLGWKSNPAKDTKGYRIYEYKNSVYNKIVDEPLTRHILGAYGVANQAEFSLATYDSCDLFAPINASHKPVYLSGNIDSCKRTISFTWNLYSGPSWNLSKQSLILDKNNTGFTLHSQIPAGTTSFSLSDIVLGDNLCYYIRSENLSTKATSSSNTVCFKTRKLRIPEVHYISNVSVVDNQIELSINVDEKADTDSILIERSENNGAFISYLKTPLIPGLKEYSLLDPNAKVNLYSYAYKAKALDKCHETSAVSNTAKSILLSKAFLIDNKYQLSWNLYKWWTDGVASQELETSTDRFTWNKLLNFDTLINSTVYTADELTSDSLCFRILNRGNNPMAKSLSNIQCIYAITDFYIPGTLNPYSQNNILKVYGKGLDEDRGKIEVFNRWGEKIFETHKVTVGWDGKLDNEFAQMGSYIYKAYFYDQRNNFYLKTGTVFIIK